ncbi:MAG: YaeQ family protein [Pseudomonadales bacterium]
MALKPTIYRFSIELADLDRERYDTLNLTVALHPSETPERMLARILAFCFSAQERLQFSRGLSDPDEPALWSRTLDGRIDSWIEVGEPTFDRIRKAISLSEQTSVYCFNTRAGVWWEQIQPQLKALPVSVYRLPWAALQTLAGSVSRTMAISVTISGGALYLSAGADTIELSREELQIA